MAKNKDRTFVGFGFGAIQAGLFLKEAHESQSFTRLVVAEVLPEVVESIRQNNGMFSVNVASPEKVDVVDVGPVEILNPHSEVDRPSLIQAIAEASEISTAVPSVDFYNDGSETCIASCLAAGLIEKERTKGPRSVVYTAENNNEAAECLEKAVTEFLSSQNANSALDRVRFLNTVIGKMSGVIGPELFDLNLEAVTPIEGRAFLVEAFNKILISRIDYPEEFEAGLSIFEQKDDLLPFEEAKLYGHNAVHALAAYLGWYSGLTEFSQMRQAPGFLPFLRGAFIEEAGLALIEKYDGLDSLFTYSGFHHYAFDLIERMTEPNLGDLIERVARDPVRKLAPEDRLVGTLLGVFESGGHGDRFAMGVVAAMASHIPGLMDSEKNLEAELRSLWPEHQRELKLPQGFAQVLEAARRRLKKWKQDGFGDLDLCCYAHRE